MQDDATMSSWKATWGAILVLILAEVIVFFPATDVGPHPVPSAAGTHRFHEPWLNTDSPPSQGLFLLGDPLLQMQPWRVHMRDVVHQGEIPYWNHLNGLGQPFLANPQTRTLYPLNWIFLSGDEMTWQLPFLALHVFLFGAGVIFLLRRFGIGFLGMSVAGASSACFGMQVIWMLSPHATTFAWFPWLLVGAERAHTRIDRKGLFLNAGATALLFLAGHPETAYKSMIAVWLFVFGRLLAERRPLKVAFRTGLALLGSQFIGVLLAMPQILPFFEYVSQSESLLMRQNEAAYPALDSWASFGRELVTWLSQIASISAHGNDLDPENWWLDKVNLREVGLIYGGALAATLGLAGFFRRHALRLPLILIGLFAMVVTFRVPFLYEALCLLPGLDVGANQRFASLLAFVLCLGSGLALDGLVGSEVATRRTWIPIVVSVIALISAVVFEALNDGPSGESQKQIFQVAMLACGAMVVGIVICVFFMKSKEGAGATLCALVLLFIMATDVGLNSRPRVPWASADATWPTTPVVDFLISHTPAKDGRILCVGASFPADMNIPHGLAFLDSYSAVQLQDEARYLEAAQTPVTPSGKKVGFWKLTDQFSPRLLNLASVRYLYIPGDWRAESARPQDEVITNSRGSRFHQLYAAQDGMVLECLDAQPRVWLASVAKKGEGITDLVQSSDDLSTTVFVASNLTLTGKGGTAKLDTYTASAMNVTAAVDGGSQMLVTSEIDSPYWQVLVDGQEAKVVRVNGIFRGVLLEEGKHQVEFRARPGDFLFWGLVASGLGLILLLVSSIRLCRSIS
ncbi:MAG: hypothetical protein ACI97A_003000 [Planctomycetota bacterium]|jgi:hypothetical protein